MSKRIILLIFIVLFATSIFCLNACSNIGPGVNNSVFISFNANGGIFQTGQLTYSISVKQGEGIELPAPPSRDGFIFIDWYLSNELKETDKLNVSLFKAVESKTIFAKWESVETYPHRIILSEYPVAIISTNLDRATMGQSVILTISFLDNAYMLKEGSLKANDVIINESDLSFIMPASEVLITGVFELRPFEINILNESYIKGKVLLGSETAKRGESITIFAIPDMGYKVDQILILNNGFEIIDNSFIMGAFDANISVSFSLIDFYEKYDISVTDNINFVSDCSHSSAAKGEYVYFSATPSPGFFVDSVFVNENEMFEDGFIMPSENVIISVSVREINFSQKYSLFLSQQPSDVGNQFVMIKDNQQLFAEGEQIELDTSELSNYVVDSVAINGVYMQPENLIMPNENAILTLKLSCRGNKIIIHEESTIEVELSHNYAQENELISIYPLSDLNDRKFTFKYWEYPNGNEIFTFYDQYSFDMPNFDICIRADAYEISSEKREISFEIEGEGSISCEKSSAGFNETVNINIIPNDALKYGLKKIFYMQEEEIIDIITINNPVIMPTTAKFFMPNSEITIHAIFESYYRIIPFENEKFSIFPDKEIALNGDMIYIDHQARNNYNLAQLIVTVSGTDLDSSGYYQVGNTDLVLGYREIEKASDTYEIKYTSSNLGGTVNGQTNARIGSLVPLEINAETGYKLSRLMIKKASDTDTYYTEIPDTFIMPSYNVSILCEFEIDNSKSFSLREKYFEIKNVFYSEYGIFLKRIDNLSGIVNYFSSYPKICSYSYYMEEVIIAETNWGCSYLIIQINHPIMVNSIAQVFDKLYSDSFDKSCIDTQIFSNLIVLSIGGSAKDDFYSFKNGLFVTENNFWVFEQEDGTYCTYRYFGEQPYVVIPKTVKINNSNSRIISSVGLNTFRDSGSIKGLALSYVRNLPDYSLSHNSLHVLELDLTQVTKIGKGSLMGLDKIKKFYVSTDNKIYSIDPGNVLFSKNKDEIITYPRGKETNEYKVPFTCKKVGDYAFYSADNLLYIMFESSNKITYIGEGAFRDCTSLISIDLNSPSQQENGLANFFEIASSNVVIGDTAFSSMPGIYNYTFPQVERIGDSVFTWDGQSELTIDFSEQLFLPRVKGAPLLYPQEIIVNNLTILLSESSYQDFIIDIIWSIFGIFYVEVEQ